MGINTIELIGWIGAVLLATCGLPQLFKTLKTKDFSGLSLTFIVWWFFGEVLTLFYIVYTAFRWPLLFNYAINIIVCIMIFILYLIFRKK
ncbi:PQ loop repeat protein [uncultured archaeon]|nr:PQ loop repeat protein [uncultured archaeon]